MGWSVGELGCIEVIVSKTKEGRKDIAREIGWVLDLEEADAREGGRELGTVMHSWGPSSQNPQKSSKVLKRAFPP